MRLLSPCHLATLACCTLALTSLVHGEENSFTPVPSEVNLIANPGFEIANSPHWRDNNWAKLDGELALDTDNPHSGQYCKRLTLREPAKKGDLQLFITPFRKGMISTDSPYKIRFWTRGEAKLTVSLRMAGAPYTTLWKTVVAPSSHWSETVLDATVPSGQEMVGVMLLFSIRDADSVWLDDVSVTTEDNFKR